MVSTASVELLCCLFVLLVLYTHAYVRITSPRLVSHQLFSKKNKSKVNVPSKGFGNKTNTKEAIVQDISPGNTSQLAPRPTQGEESLRAEDGLQGKKNRDSEAEMRALSIDNQSIEGSTNEKERLESLMKKYNMNPENSTLKKKKSKSKGSFGESVLEKIPDKLQAQLDSILLTATFGSLALVILCGIGISYGAFKVIFPTIKVPEALDGFITNVLDPAFTPAVGIFFLFSITFGLFKFAQISSDKTVYRED